MVPELFASVSKQTIQDQSTITTMYRESRGRCPKLVDLTMALQPEIGTYSKVFLIVDVLDECLEGVQGDLITKLGSLGNTTYLMVTSHPLDLIKQRFQMQTVWISMRMMVMFGSML